MCWQLDQMTISFDGGKTMMNFAEAALLIQGSTCIYGRKVKYLMFCVCVAVIDFTKYGFELNYFIYSI